MRVSSPDPWDPHEVAACVVALGIAINYAWEGHRRIAVPHLRRAWKANRALTLALWVPATCCLRAARNLGRPIVARRRLGNTYPLAVRHKLALDTLQRVYCMIPRSHDASKIIQTTLESLRKLP